ncbi:serine/threonine-protein kinase [Kitasatospora sp. NPDC001603]|uniref:serine/threonine-protein kinase n=1 Tax=Kitasatospora sp. NPDC001603 TaxID=3154388 RepID=UPI00332BFE2B
MTVTASRSTGTLFAGRYRVDSVLGRGGGADVLRAVDERLNRAVALKIPRPDATADTVRRFATEARMLARLSHPGLIEVYDYGSVAEQPYLALELVEGPTLAAVLRSGPLPAADVRRLGRDLAQTLAFVHAHGMVHRDVKPSNVLVDAAGRPRLADFGAARLLDRQASSGDEALTCTGLIVGTPAYLAPEQIRGRGALASADIYALGLLLIECLTGHREYTGAPIEAAAARLHRPPAIPPHLPADLAAVLRRMTDMDPDHRPSAATCARLLAAPPPATEPAAAGTAVVPRPSRRPHVAAPRPVLLLAASVLALAGAGGSTAFVNDPPRALPAPAAVPSAPPSTAPAPAPVPATAPAATEVAPSTPPPAPASAPTVGPVAQPAAPAPTAAPARSSAGHRSEDKQKQQGRKNDGPHGKKPK